MVIERCKEAVVRENGENKVSRVPEKLEIHPISDLSEVACLDKGHTLTIRHYWSHTKEHELFTRFTCPELKIDYVVPQLYRTSGTEGKKLLDLIKDVATFHMRCKKANCTILSE